MNIEKLHSIFLNCNNICTDTRKVQENDLFFALKGPNFNGNAYALQALNKGASYAIIDEDEYKTDDHRLILVTNTLNTLQELATYHRRKLGLKIISLTGSNGKTTTKELINAVLSKKYKTIATQGNLNNHIGVPLTLLSMDESTNIGIVEMGANHLKEIEELSSIAQPDFGYITNFGKAHLEGFGSVEGVIKGKSELYEYLINNEKLIFINNDDSIQLTKLKNYSNKFSFGKNKDTNLKIDFIKANPFVSLKVKNTIINSKLTGAYNSHNIAAAACIGIYFKVPIGKIKEALENYIPSNNRSQIIEQNENKIILDAYNANPSSMKAAIDSFASNNNTHKIAFLGDMFELGKTSKEEHQFIATYAEKKNFESLFLIGENFNQTNITNAKKFKTFEDFKKHLKTLNLKDKLILIKGSRGMELERILTFI